MHRRDFLAGAMLAAQSARGANDRVVVGLIGCGTRGSFVAQKMREAPNVEFGGVCDVYEPNAAKAREWAGPQARVYKDFRQLLERKDIDAVLIATPDHWHATAAVLSCAAGKDVYVEKPLAYSVREGQAIVAAARKYKRLAQAGTQHRSAAHFAEVAQLVETGAIGEVRFVRVWNYINMFPNGIGKEPDRDPPEGLDWDFWLGPAPSSPFNRKRFLSTFRFFYDYAGGFITDFGTHRFDTVHQIMGVDAPRTVSASGGRASLKDAGDVADLMQVTYDYPGFVMSYECTLLNGHGLGGRTPGQRYYNAKGPEDRPHGMAFYGTSGAIFADRIGYEVYPENGPTGSSLQRKSMNTTDATGVHAQKFIECIRTGKPSPAPVAVGHRSTIVAHLGNIAMKTGLKLHWDSEREDFIGAPEASKLLARQARKPWDLI